MVNYFFFFLVDHKYHKLIYQGDKSYSNLVKTETGNDLNVIIVVIFRIDDFILTFANSYILFL
jgi:hypothetical protein